MKKNLIFLITFFLINIAFASALVIDSDVPFTVTDNNVTYYIVFDDPIDNITIGSDYFSVNDAFNSTLSSSSPTDYYLGFLNISLWDTAAGSAISSFSVNVTNGQTNVFSTSNGFVEIPFLVNVSRDISFNETDFFNDLTFTMSSNYYFLNISYSLFIFKDEDTLALVTENVTVELINDDISYNYTTDTGSVSVGLLMPSEYTIRYEADSYAQRQYYLNLSTYTPTSLTLYMGNSSALTEVTITVYDTLQNPLEGARVKILRYDITTNTYLTISVKETNFAGKLTENLALNSEYYKFIVEYNGDTVLTTNPTYILDTSITLYANLLTEGFSQMFQLYKLYGIITYNNNTNIITYTYDDGNGVASGGCVYAYRNSVSGQTLVNSTCGVGAANTLYLTVDNTTGYNYEIKGYITRGTNTYYVTNLLIGFDDEIPSSDDNIILVIIMIVVLVFIGFWKLEIAVIMAGLGTMLMSVIGILSLSITYTIPLFVLSLIAAFIINKGRGGG